MDSDEVVDFEEDETVHHTSSSTNHYDDDDSRPKKIKIKGRGHSNIDNQDRYDDRGATYESIDDETERGPTKCKNSKPFSNKLYY